MLQILLSFLQMEGMTSVLNHSSPTKPNFSYAIKSGKTKDKNMVTKAL